MNMSKSTRRSRTSSASATGVTSDSRSSARDSTSLSRRRGGRRLCETRARRVVRRGVHRLHRLRQFCRRTTAPEGTHLKNFLGAFGHVALDHIFTLRRLPKPNSSIEIVKRRRSFGGTAGNLTRAAARLDVKTAIASFVGDDFPADYRDALRKEGVDLTD